MITEITLKNFRGFDDHKVYLRPITIIVGKNNAGKSTLVEALRLISIITIRSQSLKYFEIPSWLDRPRRERCVFPSASDFEFDGDSVFHLLGDPPAQITARFKSGEIIEVFIGPRREVIGIITDSRGNPVTTKTQASRVNLPEVGILPQIGPLLREELVRGEPYVRSNINSSRSSLHFRNQLYYKSDHFNAFKQLVETTRPGVSVLPVELKTLTSGEQSLSLFVRDHDFTAEIGWMGLGLQMWLQTIWFLTHENKSSFIILDEPDVYMHADLQRRLIRSLKSCSHQTIIATHSIEIMSEVESEEILIINRERKISTFADSEPEVQNILNNIGSIHNIQLARFSVIGRSIAVEGDDMIFMKRFQNTVFPKSALPIDTIPNRSVGGWSGWERVRGLALLLKNASPSIQLYCILDSDYHTDSCIKKRLETAKLENINLHIWSRKEIENYLLVPSAIFRIIQYSRKKSGMLTENMVKQKIEEIAENLKLDIHNSMAVEFNAEDREAGFAGANKKALEQLQKRWNSFEEKLSLISGKETIHRLAEWAGQEYGANLSAVKLAKGLTESEINNEVKQALRSIEDSAPFYSSR